MEKVKVLVEISGDYVDFSEVSIDVIADTTNKIWLSEESEEEFEGDFELAANFDDGEGRRDIMSFDAIKIGDEYFVKL